MQRNITETLLKRKMIMLKISKRYGNLIRLKCHLGSGIVVVFILLVLNTSQSIPSGSVGSEINFSGQKGVLVGLYNF